MKTKDKFEAKQDSPKIVYNSSFQIADQKGAESLKAFKYNESKTLNWLSLKCKKLAAALKQRNFHIGAKSLNYVKTEKFEQQSQNGEYSSFFFAFLGVSALN